MDTIYKTFRAELKEPDEDGSLNMFISVSTASMDRDSEVIEPSAFKKTIPKFMKHPVLVASHDYRDLTNQIGEWEKLKITENGIEGKPKYYVGMGNEQADWAYKLAQKCVAAFSIGFIPKEWEDGDGQKSPRRTYKEVELLEISQVIIPSNREAIQNIRSKSVDPIVKDLCDEVEDEFCSKTFNSMGKLIDDLHKDNNIITKPEETEDYIRIPVKECKITATIDISKDEGIKALYCGKEKEIATYLFLKEKGWTMAKARAWVKEHAKEYLIAETTSTINDDISIAVVKIPDTPQIYKSEKTSQEQIIDEIDYLKSLIEREGLSEEAKKSFKSLIKRLPADDIAVKDNTIQDEEKIKLIVEQVVKQVVKNS